MEFKDPKIFNDRKRFIEGYDGTVEEYHRNTKDIVEGDELRIKESFADLVRKQGKVLDLACGPGRDAEFFCRKGLDVLGVDLSLKMIEKARQVAPKAKFEVADFYDMKFEENSFDGVCFSAGLLCIEKERAEKILNDINKMLKPGGILYLSVKEGEGEGFERDERYGVEKYYAYYSEKEIRGLLGNAGFEILEFCRPTKKSAYHTHPWMIALCKKVDVASDTLNLAAKK